MTIRQSIKYWLYGRCPGFAGSFPYFGTKVYFPQNSELFQRTCREGIFESNNVRVLQKLIRSGSYFFDVGANIGLMSAPVLQAVSDVRIVSFEPSPNALPYLRQTISQSARRDRWTLVPKAVGAELGQVNFSVSKPESGAFDGIKNTQRVEEAAQVAVEMTTLDHEWNQLGRPDVSMIKIDVEGGELAVLRGSPALLENCRPFVLLEWNLTNLKAYGVAPSALFEFALSQQYKMHALPFCFPVATSEESELYAAQTETFLLVPSEACSAMWAWNVASLSA